ITPQQKKAEKKKTPNPPPQLTQRLQPQTPQPQSVNPHPKSRAAVKKLITPLLPLRQPRLRLRRSGALLQRTRRQVAQLRHPRQPEQQLPALPPRRTLLQMLRLPPLSRAAWSG